MFDATVHDSDLPAVQKLHYLKSAFKDEALSFIKKFTTVEENYLIARAAAIDRYKNKKILINAYIRNIISCKATDDTPTGITGLLDDFRNNMNGLRQCEEPLEEWNSILVHLLTSKLHPNTNKDWELQSDPKKIDPFDNLVEFLETRIRALTVANQFTASSVPKTNSSSAQARAPFQGCSTAQNKSPFQASSSAKFSKPQFLSLIHISEPTRPY